MTFQSGQAIVFRHIFRGRITYAVPNRVVLEDDRKIVSYVAPQTVVPRIGFGKRRDYFDLLNKGDWPYVEHKWFNHALQLTEFGSASSVILFWDEDWKFLFWYINLQKPIRRTAIGFDTFDQVLDIIVHPDRVWDWKDEDELQRAVELTIFSPKEAADIRAEGTRISAGIETHPFFSEDWIEWRPPSHWKPAKAPETWTSHPFAEGF